MSDYRATRLHRSVGNDSEADRTVFEGSGIVINIIVANTDDAAEDTVNFQDEDGTNLFTIEVGPNDSVDWAPAAILDNGLVVVSAGSAATTITSVSFRPQ